MPIWQGKHNTCSNGGGACSISCGPPYLNCGHGSMTPGYFVDSYIDEVTVSAGKWNAGGNSETRISSYRYTYAKEDPDTEGTIPFEISNNGLIGEGYGVIEVLDYVVDPSNVNVPANTPIEANVTITGSGIYLTGDDPFFTTPDLNISNLVLAGFSMDPTLSPRYYFQPNQPKVDQSATPEEVVASLNFGNIQDDLCDENFEDIYEITFDFTTDNNAGAENPDVPVGFLFHSRSGEWHLFSLMPYQTGTNHQVVFQSFGDDEVPLQNVDCFAVLSATDVNSPVISLQNIDANLVKEATDTINFTAIVYNDGIATDLGLDDPFMDLTIASGGNTIQYNELYTATSDNSQVLLTFESTDAPSTESASDRLLGLVSAPGVCDFVTAGDCEQLANINNMNKIHVRLISNDEDICYGHNEIVGYTGSDGLPNIKLTWLWNQFANDTCDYNNPDGIYCDSTQFMISLMDRISDIKEAYEINDIGRVNNLRKFHINLTKDGISRNFLDDFDDYYRNKTFMGVADDYKDPFEGLYKYVIDDTRFIIDEGVHDAGTYSAEILVTFDPNQYGRFFMDNEPTATINVALIPILTYDDPNPFYKLSLNGKLGYDQATETYLRIGYGTGYSGDVIDITPRAGGLELVETLPSHPLSEPVSDMLVTVDNSYQTMNLQYRGTVARLSDMNPMHDLELIYSPSIATPIMMRISEFRGDASNYYYINDGSGPINTGDFASYWTGAASTFSEDCLSFDGSKLFYKKIDTPASFLASEPSCGLKVGIPQSSAYGFSYENVPPGEVLLKTIFYTPDESHLFIPACTLGDNRPPEPNQFFATPTQPLLGHDTPILLDYSKSQGLNFESIGELFQMAENEDMCIGRGLDGAIEIWWNSEPLMLELDTFVINYFSDVIGEELFMCSDLTIIDPTINNAPLPLLVMPSVASEGTEVEIIANGVDPDFDPMEFSIMFGDGSGSEIVTPPTPVTHTFFTDGTEPQTTYTVTLTVSDGHTSVQLEKEITIIKKFENGDFDNGMTGWNFQTSPTRWASSGSTTVQEITSDPDAIIEPIEGNTFIFGAVEEEDPDESQYTGQLNSSPFTIPDAAEYLALKIKFKYENLNSPEPSGSYIYGNDPELISTEGVYIDLWSSVGGNIGSHIMNIGEWTADTRTNYRSSELTATARIAERDRAQQYILSVSIIGDEDSDDTGRVAVDRVCWSRSNGRCI